VSKQKVVSTPVSAGVTAHSEKSAGPEQECLGDLDDNMNIDEEVDMNIDPLLREPRHQPQVGPSRSVFPSVTPSALIMPSRPSPPSVGLAETFVPSFTLQMKAGPQTIQALVPMLRMCQVILHCRLID